ncbi:type IV pilus modification protein PilV [Tahibacter amnicola]|uniref:Type IV pilus modification protein PilV n=1 Tax=Tahibacter amnicola TaxID=2976241 RepID=A0ABY6BD88_9GAMM|nr:type IV pilus modification protein PilV [Tahibacter amnicola]UXI67183.1 type IV pilus modification protein PilV [Tahibacter amnicola]
MYTSLKRTRGFSLLEVLVALLIFGLGLLGLAGLLVVSVKTNHSSYLRTQASFLAEGMADRIKANRMALWNDRYNGDYSAATAAAPTKTCLGAEACSEAEIALRDRAQWSAQLVGFLPNATANIRCALNPGVAIPASARHSNPPYDGLCSVWVRWSEKSLNTDTGAASVQDQTFAWVFEP